MDIHEVVHILQLIVNVKASSLLLIHVIHWSCVECPCAAGLLSAMKSEFGVQCSSLPAPLQIHYHIFIGKHKSFTADFVYGIVTGICFHSMNRFFFSF